MHLLRAKVQAMRRQDGAGRVQVLPARCWGAQPRNGTTWCKKKERARGWRVNEVDKLG